VCELYTLGINALGINTQGMDTQGITWAVCDGCWWGWGVVSVVGRVGAGVEWGMMEGSEGLAVPTAASNGLLPPPAAVDVHVSAPVLVVY
jgi:hypothetical protein